jgi:hypothetical protein
MWWKKNTGDSRRARLTDGVARRIAAVIIKMEKRIVSVLQRWDKRHSVREKKIVLIAFCLCCSLFCAMLLADAVIRRSTMKVLPVMLQFDPGTFARRTGSCLIVPISRCTTGKQVQ